MTDTQYAERYSVVIVGGGAGGLSVAARLRRAKPELTIAVIDPSATHAYQPGWTLVGAGVMPLASTLKQQGGLIPHGVTWIRERVRSIHPEDMTVALDNGAVIEYRRLVVCPGIQLNWDAIDGLKETLGRNGVTSNYDRDGAAYTWECVRNLNGGTAIFTQPPMPIKCAGAPQKAVYLSCDYWRREGVLHRIKAQFCLAGDKLFGINYYVPSLQKVVDYYGIELRFKENLIAIDGEKKEATFQIIGTDQVIVRPFDMIHVVPPQSAPDFVRQSVLANEAGWLDVDSATLRHNKFETVFGLGDVLGTSNAKTAAAVREQAPVLVKNLISSLAGEPLEASYDGYGACPLTVSYGKVVLAEFLYGGKVVSSLRYDQRKPSRIAWNFKAKIFPKLYWYGMLRGIDPKVSRKQVNTES
ncbi:FAD-dependent oxidoreductase [Aristophania vespae]|uniref:FAD-dependent oxidoreductase n=1 Tax=Aristophania vespae TaxID=2697033 RepID=A0A6P1NFF3_9PROT|nr:FAD/NAD(P)-binding oxidoreductase [Aristophania vespae]QHI96178.1 FAD-dependent oxidoreductase [Aristophania vespae]UMM63967.1 Sulfide dehydrogenase [flavocytochrome c] flavoprotein chain [Aristophania vespae]